MAHDIDEEFLLATASKNVILEAIVEAFKHRSPEDLPKPDVEKARRYAKACYGRGFLLSPLETLFISVAIYPAIDPTGGADLDDKQFHARLWQGSINRLKPEQHCTLLRMLFGVTEVLLHVSKFASARYILTLAEPYVRAGDEALYWDALGRQVSSRLDHPSYRYYTDISNLPEI